LVFAVLLFVAGLILGYYFWGLNKEKRVDYKAFLQETINYIATLEHKNKKLIDEVDVLETEISMLQEKQSAGAVQSTDQIDALSQRISVLEKENQQLGTCVSENKELVQENQQLKQKLQTLMGEVSEGKPDVPPSVQSTTNMPDESPLEQ